MPLYRPGQFVWCRFPTAEQHGAKEFFSDPNLLDPDVLADFSAPLIWEEKALCYHVTLPRAPVAAR